MSSSNTPNVVEYTTTGNIGKTNHPKIAVTIECWGVGDANQRLGFSSHCSFTVDSDGNCIGSGYVRAEFAYVSPDNKVVIIGGGDCASTAV